MKEGADDGTDTFTLTISNSGLTGSRTCEIDDDSTPFDNCVTLTTGGDGISMTAQLAERDLNATIDGTVAVTSLPGLEFTVSNELELLHYCAYSEILI